MKLDDLFNSMMERIIFDKIMNAVKRHFFNGALFDCFDFRNNTIFEKVNHSLSLSAEIVFHLEDSIKVKDVFIIDKFDIDEIIIKQLEHVIKQLESEKDCQK